jgi:hypothetical protein
LHKHKKFPGPLSTQSEVDVHFTKLLVTEVQKLRLPIQVPSGFKTFHDDLPPGHSQALSDERSLKYLKNETQIVSIFMTKFKF